MLTTVEDKVVTAKVGRLLVHRVGGSNGIRGDKPFRYSYYEAPAGDSIASLKGRLASSGLQAIRPDQRCDASDPCAFEDPETANVLVSVVVADRKTVSAADKVTLPAGSQSVVVVGIF